MKTCFPAVLVIMVVMGIVCCWPKPSICASDDITSSALRFVEMLASKNYVAVVDKFDKALAQALPEPRLREAWESMLDQCGSFKGQLGTQVRTMSGGAEAVVGCRFARSDVDIRFVFNKTHEIIGLWFAPTMGEYALPTYADTKRVQECSIRIGSGKRALPGVLSMPRGNGPFPAVVLVHGSGPQDRDETIGPNRPFKDIAWGLATEGIAVLRYDKRTKVHPAAIGPDATVKDEVIDDALLAISLLRKASKINHRRIFVLGHSLGGTLSPKIARLAPDVAGIIVMAGSTRPPGEMLSQQISYLASLNNAQSVDEEKEIASALRQAQRIQDPRLSKADGVLLGVPAAYWLDLRDYDPSKDASTLQIPMLIMQGKRDYQVTVEDYNGWRHALRAHRNITFKLYPQLNHLFMAGKGKSTPAEYQVASHVDPLVVHDISHWIHVCIGGKP